MDKRKGKSFTVSDKTDIIAKQFFLCWNTLNWHYRWDVHIKHNCESCEAIEGSYFQYGPVSKWQK